jgi:aryl hydrocarbon receptor
LGKRTMDFKVTYLDAGLTSAYFSDGEAPPSNGSSTPAAANTTTGTKVPKRYKAHLRDFLSSCRGKRAKHTHHSPTGKIHLLF